MKKLPLKSLEKRLAKLDVRVAQPEPHKSKGIVWRAWRLAVGKIKRTEIREEIDEPVRKFREADQENRKQFGA